MQDYFKFSVSCGNTLNDIDAHPSLFLSLLEGFPCWANFGNPKTRINHDKNTFFLAITPLLFFIITTLLSLCSSSPSPTLANVQKERTSMGNSYFPKAFDIGVQFFSERSSTFRKQIWKSMFCCYYSNI